MSEKPSASGRAAGRRLYRKPLVRRFPLRPDEAVLGGCKTSGSAGPGNVNCRVFGVCRHPGS